MKIKTLNDGAFGSALVDLEPGERFVSEAGAMYRASANINIKVTTRTGKKGKGGLFKGLKRAMAGESVFFSHYETTDGRNGEVGIAPALPGRVHLIPMDGTVTWLCTGGSYLASESTLDVDTKFQGLKGLVSGENMLFIQVRGHGQLVVSAFGRIVELEVKHKLIVDTGHVVAYTEGLKYKLTKAGGSWLHSFLGGEGVVMRFEGKGKVLLQSHNPKEFGRSLGALLPSRG